MGLNGIDSYVFQSKLPICELTDLLKMEYILF